jgi:hypothetical protein
LDWRTYIQYDCKGRRKAENGYCYDGDWYDYKHTSELQCKRGQASFETNENCKRNCISWDTIFYIDDYDRYSGGIVLKALNTYGTMADVTFMEYPIY